MSYNSGIFATSLKLLPNLIIYGSAVGRYNYLKGYYYVANEQGAKYFNSPEGIPQFLKIDISLMNPNVLNVVSKDFDKKNHKCWKTWTNEIAMGGRTGKGRYIYDIGNETGFHEIVTETRDKIVVRVIKNGKANWEDEKSDDLSLQTWMRVQRHDPMLDRFKAML